MTDDERNHLRLEDYVSASRRPDGAGLLARHAHRHLVALCDDCGPEWRRLGQLRATYHERLRAFESPPPAAAHADEQLLATGSEIERQVVLTDDLIREYRNVLNQKSILLRRPPGERPGLIRRAHRRYRSPLLAEMLVEECRQRVRNEPAEAVEIAALVPLVLARTGDADPPPAAAPALLARAAAHRANALRVMGDLPAAEHAFAELRRRLADRPLADPRDAAEIDSLEASLCIGLRRLEKAEDHLDRAALSYEHAGDQAGLSRATIKHANLLGSLGRPRELLALLTPEAVDRARSVEPYLYVCAVTARVNALCDLEAPDEAARLLDADLDAFEEAEDLTVGSTLRWLRGRVALGRGDLLAAEGAFRDASDALLAIGRSYDAALITLFLAETLHRAGKTRDLATLARGLVDAFRSRGVAGEALAALKLLADAVASGTVSAALLARLRRRLATPGAPPHAAPLASP
jgi:tetratricopeptide (TPR) repeat protein